MRVVESQESFFIYGQVERQYAHETQAKLRDCFRSWLVPWFGNQELSEITRVDILHFRKAMADRGLSISRQYSLLTVLKLLLKFCRTVLGISTLDPAEIKLPRRIRTRVEFLSEEEVQGLIRIIPTHTKTGLRVRALIEVLLSTGMRISEASSLDQGSIDRQTGEAEIIGKGNKRRTVFFSPSCLKWIDKYMERRLDQHPALFVTTGRNPRRLSRNDMSKLFRRLRERSGIFKHLTPHLLRHTFCTRLLHNGADITFIKELAGHQDIETTARYYLGVDKKTLKSVLQKYRCHGWTENFVVEDGSMPPLMVPDTPGTAHAPSLPPYDPGPNSTGRSFPGVHGPESL